MSENKNEEKNRSRIPFKTYLIYLAVISFILTGVTFAKYVSVGTGSDMARVATFGDLDLYEVDETGNRIETPVEFKVIPGANIFKKPVIDYAVTSNSEMLAYVFVEVKTKGWDTTKNKYMYSISRPAEGKNPTVELMSWKIINPGWAHIETTYNSSTGITSRVYCKLVQEGLKLEKEKILQEDALGNTITVSSEMTENELNNALGSVNEISFQAYAVQAGGFKTVNDAWKAVAGK